MNTTIDFIERKMTITYMHPNGYDFCRFTGWCMLSTNDTSKIIARKIGGRNRWHLTNTHDIIDAKGI